MAAAEASTGAVVGLPAIGADGCIGELPGARNPPGASRHGGRRCSGIRRRRRSWRGPALPPCFPFRRAPPVGASRGGRELPGAGCSGRKRRKALTPTLGLKEKGRRHCLVICTGKKADAAAGASLHGKRVRKGTAGHVGQDHESPLRHACPARSLLTHPGAGKSPPICPSVGACGPGLLRPHAVPCRHCGNFVQRAARHAGAPAWAGKRQFRGSRP